MRKNKSIRAEILRDFSHGAIFYPVRFSLHDAGVNGPSLGAGVTPLSHGVEFSPVSSALLLISRTKLVD
ncbi:uncharacterized protein G2W53_015198 [Senna tora]|uniref:Uncharacterized protein n=1 Tax=Senna tora TaxID=362788 RepID=A0A834WUH4_9FABA|nr:uncharacterized protein G2W53_015198 [Senna tora]